MVFAAFFSAWKPFGSSIAHMVYKRMTNMKIHFALRRLLIPAFLIPCLLLACTVKNTPRHSLSQLRTALLNHDADDALRYLDLDSIVDAMIRDKFAKYEEKAEDPLQVMGVRAGREVVKILSPGLKGLLRAQVRSAITSPDEMGYFDYIRKSSVWYLNIRIDGETALVEPKGQSDIKFKMARAPEGYWRIVEIIVK